MRSHFPKHRRQVLSAIEGIRGTRVAAVPEPDVQKTIGAKDQLAALMVGKRLVYNQQNTLAARVGLVGICSGSLELGNDALPYREGARVVHVELTVGAVIGMEGQTQQALFCSVEVHQALDVQKISRQQGAIGDDADGPRLLDYEQAIVARRFFQTERAAETTHHRG